MRRFSAVRAFLSFTLVLAAPGLGPYSVLAQVAGNAAVSQTGAIGPGAAAAISALAPGGSGGLEAAPAGLDVSASNPPAVPAALALGAPRLGQEPQAALPALAAVPEILAPIAQAVAASPAEGSRLDRSVRESSQDQSARLGEAARKTQSIAEEAARAAESIGPVADAPAEEAGAFGSRLIRLLTREQQTRPDEEDSAVPAAGEPGAELPPGLSGEAKDQEHYARPAGKGIEEAVRAYERGGELSELGGFFLPIFGPAAPLLFQVFTSLSPLAAVAAFLLVGLPSWILHEIGHARVARRLGDTLIERSGRASLRLRDMGSHLYLRWTVLLPILTLLVFRLPLGFAKPVVAHGSLMARPEIGLTRTKAMAWVAWAGPVVNLALAAGFGLLHLGWAVGGFGAFFGAAALLAVASALALRAARLLTPEEAVRTQRVIVALAALAGGVQWAASALGLPDFLPTLLSMGVFYNVLLALFNLLPLHPFDGHYIARSIVADWLGRRELAEKYFGPASPAPPGGLLVRLKPDRPATEDIDLEPMQDGDLNARLDAQDRLRERVEAAGIPAPLLARFGVKPVAIDRGANSAFLRSDWSVLNARFFDPEDGMERAGLIVTLGAGPGVEDFNANDPQDARAKQEVQRRITARLEAAGIPSWLLELFGAAPLAASAGLNAVFLGVSPSVSPQLRAYWASRGIAAPESLAWGQLLEVAGTLRGELEARGFRVYGKDEIGLEGLRPGLAGMGFQLYENDAAGVRAFLEDVPGASKSALGRRLNQPFEWKALRWIHWYATAGTMIFLGQYLLAGLYWTGWLFHFGFGPK